MSFFSVEWLKPVDVSNSPGRQARRQKHFIGLLPPAGGEKKGGISFSFHVAADVKKNTAQEKKRPAAPKRQ